MKEKCPQCGSEDRTELGDECVIPEGTSDRHIPADEFAHDWHFEEEG